MLESVQNFVLSEAFWKIHGIVLALLWIIIAPIGVFIKRKNTELHLLSFAIVDYGTLFFAGAGIYRLWPEFHNYF